MSEGARFEVDAPSLRKLLTGLRDLPPKVRTRVRRELRNAGKAIVEEQRKILDGPLPPSGARGDRRRGMRTAIKKGLKFAIVTGQTRQGLDFKTTGPKGEKWSGYNMAKVWNSKKFRHPVFGNRDKWVDQQGQPYFAAPVFAGRDRLLEQVTEILNREIEGA